MKKPTLNIKSGFSLVELLVVIAVIAVIAAIAIPNIANITGAAGTSRDQRNAQNLASVFNAARAAGWNASIASGANITTDANIAELTDSAGVGIVGDGSAGNGIPNGMSFACPMAAAELATAASYLSIAGATATASTMAYSTTAATSSSGF